MLTTYCVQHLQYWVSQLATSESWAVAFADVMRCLLIFGENERIEHLALLTDNVRLFAGHTWSWSIWPVRTRIHEMTPFAAGVALSSWTTVFVTISAAYTWSLVILTKRTWNKVAASDLTHITVWCLCIAISLSNFGSLQHLTQSSRRAQAGCSSRLPDMKLSRHHDCSWQLLAWKLKKSYQSPIMPKIFMRQA